MDLASIKKFFASLTLQKLVPVILIVVIGLLLVKLLLKLFQTAVYRISLCICCIRCSSCRASQTGCC